MKAAVLAFMFAAVSAHGANVLYFRDVPIGADRMAEALAASGHAVTVAADAGDFQIRIESGAFDLGVFFVQKRVAAEYAPAIQSLGAFVNAGGRAFYADWSQNSALAAVFGASFAGAANPKNLRAGTALVPANIALRNTGWFAHVANVLALPGASVAARFDDGGGAIVRASHGRSFVFGFLGDAPASSDVFARAVGFVFASPSDPVITFADPPAVPGVGGVTVRGSVLPNGAATQVSIDFGLGNAFDRHSVIQNAGSGLDPVPVEFSVSGLAGRTTYRYRYRVVNTAGTILSDSDTFTTLNTPPVARDDHPQSGTAGVTFDPTFNDADADDDPLTLASVTSGQFGAVGFSGNFLTYRPAENILRADRFTYTVSDGFAGFATANVDVEMPLEEFRGDYSHLLLRDGGIIGGRLSLTLAGGGAFTGRLMLGADVRTVSGVFGRDGKFTAILQRESASPLTIELELRLSPESPSVFGIVSDGAESWTIRAPAGAASRLAGRYTLVAADAQTAGIPRGHAWAILRGDSSGTLRLAGRFADGVPFAGDALLQTDGSAPLYFQRTSPPVETLAGLVQFSGTRFSGEATWTRIPMVTGFTAKTSIVGSRVRFASAAQPVFRFTDPSIPRARALLFADSPRFPRQRILQVGRDAILALPAGTDRFRLNFSSGTGLFFGSFVHPAFGPCRISGVLMQSENAAYGNFFGGEVSGSFQITPR